MPFASSTSTTNPIVLQNPNPVPPTYAMAENSTPPKSTQETYPLFYISDPKQSTGLGLGFGFFDSPQKNSLPPLPSPIEVFPAEKQETSPQAKPIAEPITINDNLVLLKGKVNTFDVFRVSNSDLVPGKYEGGLKLWEGSLDLVKALCSDVQEGRLSLKGKRVLELGCGHGLPGIFTCLHGPVAVHFQDFNSEVLHFLTIPNVKVNLLKAKDNTETIISPAVRFFSGDWSDIHQLLLLPVCTDDHQKATEITSPREDSDGYDVILMAESVYALSSLQSLYELINKCLCRYSGVVYMAGKKHYFGVCGGTRQFLQVLEQDGSMSASLLAEVTDGQT